MQIIYRIYLKCALFVYYISGTSSFTLSSSESFSSYSLLYGKWSSNKKTLHPSPAAMADLSGCILITFCSSTFFIIFIFISPSTYDNFPIPYASITLFPTNLPTSSAADLEDYEKSSSKVVENFISIHFECFVIKRAYIDFCVLVKEKSPFERIEEGLARSRIAIRSASWSQNYRPQTDEGFVPRGPVYRNPHTFYQLSFYLFFHTSKCHGRSILQSLLWLSRK